MTNEEHLTQLRQGVTNWNAWRRAHPEEMRPDLRGCDLSEANLSRANLAIANLSRAFLSDTNLSLADLSGADLSGTDLSLADLSGADLSSVNLAGADLRYTKLNEAILRYADLRYADLSRANLALVDLSAAVIEETTFGDVDLRSVKGLDTVEHWGPSTIGTNTLVCSQGQIPEAFLRGAGLPDSLIESVRTLFQRPVEYYTCFISYSAKDQDFAKQLHTDLQSKGVRCWFAPHDLRPGELILNRIDESIRLYDKLVLVLSEHSIASSWVEVEVQMALAKERKQHNQTVLFPIRIDHAIMDVQVGWPAHFRETRHIADFEHWEQRDNYQRAFGLLLYHLQPESPQLQET